MNLNQVLHQTCFSTPEAPEIAPADILSATSQDADGRPRCPQCGKGIYLEVERRDAGVIPYAVGDADLEFDPDDSDGTDTTLISAYCACGWAYPDVPEALFATTIGYRTVLAWETGQDSLCEMLTDVAYAQWQQARPDQAAQYADTYQAQVTPTPSGYRVTLLALEWEVATPVAPDTPWFCVIAGADPQYPLDIGEYRDRKAVLLDPCNNRQAMRGDSSGATRAACEGNDIGIPDGQRDRCTGAQ